VGQQVVAEQHRLGVLEVGAAGHGHPEMLLRLVGQRVHDVQQVPGQHARAVAQEHLEQGGDLVVARAPGTEPAAEPGAEALDEQPLQRPVHVLVGRVGLHRAGGDVGRQEVDASGQRGQLVLVEQSGGVQNPRMRPRPQQVVPREPPVEVGRPGQRDELWCGTVVEPAAPQPTRCRRAAVAGFGHSPAIRWSRAAASLLGRPHSSTKPRASDWSNESPAS
jgi:hypothetical protein